MRLWQVNVLREAPSSKQTAVVLHGCLMATPIFNIKWGWGGGWVGPPSEEGLRQRLRTPARRTPRTCTRVPTPRSGAALDPLLSRSSLSPTAPAWRPSRAARPSGLCLWQYILQVCPERLSVCLEGLPYVAPIPLEAADPAGFADQAFPSRHRCKCPSFS